MKIKIKNFRSFRDTDYIDIKPITILIGRNSSGKSSFLRTFPMLKQSFEERTRSPILLYGNYIDFGSYQDIKPNFVEENEDDSYELGFIFDKNVFTRADLRTISSVTTGNKTIKIVSSHPEGSYKLVTGEDKNITIEITSPSKFWSVSKYLVVQI